MQAIKKNKVKSRWERITKLGLNNLPLLSAGEQTKRSWAKEIESLDMVPEIYKDFYADLLEAGTPISLFGNHTHIQRVHPPGN